jgi:hypothetical protein
MNILKIFIEHSKSPTNGSKLVARSQRDYFGKGLHVLFPNKTFHANEILNEFFCNLFLKIFKCSPRHHIYFLFIIE